MVNSESSVDDWHYDEPRIRMEYPRQQLPQRAARGGVVAWAYTVRARCLALVDMASFYKNTAGAV